MSAAHISYQPCSLELSVPYSTIRQDVLQSPKPTITLKNKPSRIDKRSAAVSRNKTLDKNHVVYFYPARARTICSKVLFQRGM
eukprot:5002603-Amphidinium_carterae.1